MTSELLTTARLLAEARPPGPTQTDLRRAVSTAYYAVFHGLARTCADQVVGRGQAGSEEWDRAYRALDHGAAKQALLNLPPAAGEADKQFAEIFARLQKARHRADYDPSAPFLPRARALELIGEAEVSLDLLAGLSPRARRIVTVHVLLRERKT